MSYGLNFRFQVIYNKKLDQPQPSELSALIACIQNVLAIVDSMVKLPRHASLSESSWKESCGTGALADCYADTNGVQANILFSEAS
jgi:hypothetical protein